MEYSRWRGGTITTSTSLASDDTRALGVPVVTTQVYTVQDGKTKSLKCSWTEGSLAALKAATAALPVTGGELFPTHTLVAVLGGLATLGRAGMALLRLRSHQQQ